MSKHIFKFLSLLVVSTTILTGCSKKADISSSRANEVIVYTYDSFCSEWGPGSVIAEKFTAKTGMKVTYVDCGDGVQVLSRAVLEKNNVQCDVILGLDNNLSAKAEKEGILESYKPEGRKNLSAGLEEVLGGKWLLTPFDFSPFAMIFDSECGLPAPQCLDDMTKPEYAKKIILMNPRTSTPGLGFAAWTVAAKGDAVLDYWKALKPNLLTMTPGWSAGYGLFKKGEAPLVSSYCTSAASHIEYDNTNRFKTLIFTDGHVMQVEGAGVAKNAPNKKGAEAFIDFLISDEAQAEIPLTQWMFPANRNAVLPESYIQGAPMPEKILSYDVEKVNTAVEQIMAVLGE